MEKEKAIEEEKQNISGEYEKKLRALDEKLTSEKASADERVKDLEKKLEAASGKADEELKEIYMFFGKKKEERTDQNIITTENIGAGIIEALVGSTSKLTKLQVWEIPSVQSCITLIADKIASLPIKLCENKDGKVSEVKEDRRVQLLNRDTGDTMNATEMRREWIKDYYLGKGAYTYIDRDAFGDIRSIRYVDEEQVSAVYNADPIFKSYSLIVGGNRYFPHQFLKILRNTKGYGTGKPLTAENPLLFAVAYNTMKYENVLVKKGGNKKGFLMSKNKLSDPAMDKLKEAWRKLYENDADNDNVIVLNDGMDFKESSSTSVEMQLNERKENNRKEICSLFEIPFNIINGTATEQVQGQWVKNGIVPLLNVIEAALDSDLLCEKEKAYRYFAFDTTELTRGDFLTRMNGYAVALQNNIMQLDEVREREDLEPTGFNFMRLGLNDVLLDVRTNRIYTPNTNQYQDLGVMPTGSSEEASESLLTDAEERAIIEERGNPNHDKKGRFTFGKVRMSYKEVKRVSSQIATDFPTLKADGKIHNYENRNHFYRFTVNEFGSYNFLLKIKIVGNEDMINYYRNGGNT